MLTNVLMYVCSSFIVLNEAYISVMNEEPLRTTTPPPEKERESFLPQWAIAVIVVGAASLIFIILFAAVAVSTFCY